MRLMIIVRASRAIILCLLERCWGLNSDTARRLGPVFCQGGEFAFALLAADAIQGVIGEPIANLLTLAVTLSMAPAQDTRRHNNAIHDYRYDRWFAPQRSELLLRHSLTILRGCLDASDTVRQAFEDN